MEVCLGESCYRLLPSSLLSMDLHTNSLVFVNPDHQHFRMNNKQPESRPLGVSGRSAVKSEVTDTKAANLFLKQLHRWASLSPTGEGPYLHTVPLRRLGSFLPNNYFHPLLRMGSLKFESFDASKFGQHLNIGQIYLFYRLKVATSQTTVIYNRLTDWANI
jgi:hypothetical protein